MGATVEMMNEMFLVSRVANAWELLLSAVPGPWDAAGNHDTLVAKQHGYHKQISHSQCELPLSFQMYSLPPFLH